MEEAWLHLEAVEAVRQRATRRAARTLPDRREKERGGLTGVQSTRMLCMQMRSDRPIGYPVLQRPPHGSSSTRSLAVLPSHPRPPFSTLLPRPESARPARSIRFRKNVLYKQKQIKTLILLYVNRRGETVSGPGALRGGAACLLSLQARTRGFSSPPVLHGLCTAAACRQPIHLADTYDVLLIRHLYVIEKTAIFAVGGTVQWWKPVLDTDHRRQCTRLSCVKRMREDG